MAYPRMIILGLTGSMATGKSTVVTFLEKLWYIPVWDADHEVRILLEQEDVQAQVKHFFPEAFPHGQFDRPALRSLVFNKPEYLLILESLLYPLLLINMKDFIHYQNRLRSPLIVLDVPLLYECGWHVFCDYVMVTTCRSWLQERRILRRPGMTRTQMQKILAKQWNHKDKEALADFVIHTDHHKRETIKQVAAALKEIAKHLA